MKTTTIAEKLEATGERAFKRSFTTLINHLVRNPTLLKGISDDDFDDIVDKLDECLSELLRVNVRIERQGSELQVSVKERGYIKMFLE